MTADLQDITVSEDRPLYTKVTAAKALGVSVWTIDRWRKAGLLKSVQGIGQRVRIHPAEVERLARGMSRAYGEAQNDRMYGKQGDR